MSGPNRAPDSGKIHKKKSEFSLTKRAFIMSLFIVGISLFLIIFSYFSLLSDIRSLFYRIYNRIKKTKEIPPASERKVAILPADGETISVEMALNSRCSSDYDGNQNLFHWGLFDRSKKLSQEHIKRIINFARIPRFTQHRLKIQADQNVITFVVDNCQTSDLETDWAMIESGMQQQAIVLVCAALGAGMRFRSIGKNGRVLSDTDYETIKMYLDAMEPSYKTSFWTNAVPTNWKSWQKGNLPDPVRQGNKPLIEVLQSLQTEEKGTSELSEEVVSQLLWAARGRTPHLYKSKPWGMTIPTWGGEQNISRVYYISDNKLFKYVNWRNNRPTQSLSGLGNIDEKLVENFVVSSDLESYSRSGHKLIIFEKNEVFTRALWEIGYQMLNVLLQASSLNIFYKALLLNDDQKKAILQMGIKNPVAVFSF